MSESFIVSARKYRPDSWETVVGQKNITSTLQNAIATDKIAHAYLFTGPRGVGKTTCARIFARAINNMLEASDQDIAFNIIELDAASNNSVDDIRTIVDTVRIPPQIGKYKVYIIDEVHMLSPAAFNAFLKTLEEPPAHAIFILATTEKHKIIPTILSRCQIFDFARIKVKDTTEHLAQIATKEGITFEPEALNVIAQKADGAMRDALSIFDQVVAFCGKNLTYQAVIQNLNVLDYEYYFRLTDFILKEDIPASLLLFDEVLNKGFDAHHFINGLGGHFRNLMVCKDAQTIQLMETTESAAAKYAEQAKATSVMLLVKGLDFINTCDVQYRTSKHQRLLVEITLMQLCSIPINEREGEKKKFRLKPFRSGNGIQPSVAQQASTRQNTSPPPPSVQPPAPAIPVYNPSPEVSPSVAEARTTFGKKNLVFSSPESFSLKKSLAKTGSQKPEISKEEVATEVLANSTFSKDDFEKTWLEFAERQRIHSASLCSTLKSQVPSVSDSGVITMRLVNSVQQMDVESVRGDLLNYMKRELQFSAFTLSLEMLRHDEIKMVIKSPKEKFDLMVQKNPALDTLRKKFNLQIDF